MESGSPGFVPALLGTAGCLIVIRSGLLQRFGDIVCESHVKRKTEAWNCEKTKVSLSFGKDGISS